MEQPLFRKQSMERVSSPEQLSDYLHVTSPAIWIVLAAVILLLASLFVWSSVTAIESYAAGEAEVHGGVLTLQFDDGAKASRVEVGMNVKVGELTAPILSVGSDENGNCYRSLALGAHSHAVGRADGTDHRHDRDHPQPQGPSDPGPGGNHTHAF